MNALLTLLILYHCGHEVGRFISLEKLVEEIEARAENLMSGRGSKAMRIKLYVRSSASDVFTFDEVQQALPDISADHIRSELRKLRDAGVVESPGRGRKEWRRHSTAF